MFSEQVIAVYRVLLGGNELTAKDIGKELDVVANSVYRVVKTLTKLGFVEKLKGRPVRFRAKREADGLSSFFILQREWFLDAISVTGKVKRTFGGKTRDVLNVSFVQSRKESIERSTLDIRNASEEVCLFVSGDEVPAETILEEKRAIERGVQVRVLVQKLDESNREMIMNWKRMGMQVRFYPSIGARVIIIDSKVVYIVSHDPKKIEEGVGVRFNYKPIALLMREIFGERWEKAEELIK